MKKYSTTGYNNNMLRAIIMLLLEPQEVEYREALYFRIISKIAPEDETKLVDTIRGWMTR